MIMLLTYASFVIAAAAAVRSTWSPCGVSMLATITPLAEGARGHRYSSTAAWFVLGAVIGGTTLGLVMASLALVVHEVGMGPTVIALVACSAALVAAGSDARVGGFHLPVHHRQVNERWLDGFRTWVYGAGFGWQIGSGLATYIKTAAVFLLMVLAAVTGSPSLAFLLGAVFGLVRGLAVLLGRTITSPAALAAFHQRFSAWEPRTRAAVIASEVGVAVAFALAVSPWAGVAITLAIAVLVTKRVRQRAARSAVPIGAVRS